MEEGYPFVIRREEEAKLVDFADMAKGRPYDMPNHG